jgi:hypothetical protein
VRDTLLCHYRQARHKKGKRENGEKEKRRESISLFLPFPLAPLFTLEGM